MERKQAVEFGDPANERVQLMSYDLLMKLVATADFSGTFDGAKEMIGVYVGESTATTVVLQNGAGGNVTFPIVGVFLPAISGVAATGSGITVIYFYGPTVA